MANHALQPRDSNPERAAFDVADANDDPLEDASFRRLRGILKATYEQLGGAEAFHCGERESWER